MFTPRVLLAIHKINNFELWLRTKMPEIPMNCALLCMGWIKIDHNRGDSETFSVEGYERAKGRLDLMEADMGPIAERRRFVVEDHLPRFYLLLLVWLVVLAYQSSFVMSLAVSNHSLLLIFISVAVCIPRKLQVLGF